MRQTVLPFKLDTTEDCITAHAGLALLGEFIEASKLKMHIDRALPEPGSATGYAPSQVVISLLLMLHGGGRSLEDIRQLRQDQGLVELLGLQNIPSADALGDWLRRMGAGAGLAGLEQVNRALLSQAFPPDVRQSLTLDIDASQIIAEKQAAQYTYKGEKGYMPIIGHLAENGMVIAEEFRQGNASPGAGNLAFIQHFVKQVPVGQRIGALRSDSAAYQAKIFNHCEEQHIQFAIGADLDAAVCAAIAQIQSSAWVDYRDGQIAETVHCMNASNHAFRLIVVRRAKQMELLEATGLPYRYSVMASNRAKESASQTMDWYCQRGEHSENRIKDLKIGFAMERMPCGQMAANAVFFRIGVLAYNLFILFKLHALDKSWHKHQIQTLRWRLYQIAGKVVRHAGTLTLTIKQSWQALFASIRARTFALASAGPP